MTSVITRTLFNGMAMAKASVHSRGAAGYRSARCRLRPMRSRLTSRLLLCALLTLGALAAPAAAAETPDANFAPQGPLGFDSCARLAIRQSPYFTKSSVEIDIRRMDESDSRYTMVPPVTFRTIYYVDRPNDPLLNPRPYSLNFSTEPYNPFGSYYTLQAQKLATRMAIFAHLKSISEGLERIGKLFLNLEAIKRLAALQADLVNLSKENLIYAENRLSIGTGTSLEVRVATQELELAKSEQQRLNQAQRHALANLKSLLGLKPEQQLELDLRDARHQVRGGFDPAAATLEQAKAKSYDLKIMELKKEIQGYNIVLAKSRVFPSLLFTTQSADPLSITTAKGVYVGLGVEVPVWDGFKRIRNVSRQKAVLKQYSTDKDLKEIDLADKWTTGEDDLGTAAANLKMAQSQEELARLKERQSEIRYQSGQEPLPSWLAARKAVLEAQKATANKTLESDESILNLRQISGDLGYSYVDPNSWEK